MSPADKLLPLLERVRRVGPGRWTARSPTREDKSPSLSIRELDDGRLLLHDFGGSSVEEVLGAVGLQLADLFPPRDDDAAPGRGTTRERRPWAAADLLRLAAFEASICVIVTADMLAGRDADRARLIEAARRLGDIVEACAHEARH